MKAKELKGLTDAELEQKIHSLKEELFKLNCQRQAGRVEKPHRFSLLKKDIARIKTILKERERGDKRR